jgi:CRP-like cAMP-binding protein
MFIQDLTQLPLFQDMSTSQIAQLEPLMEVCDYSKDTLVFEQGDPAQYLYIVRHGLVLVQYRAYDGPVISVARVGPGGIFGWSSALGRTCYTSEAVCIRDTLVYRIRGKSLQTLREQYPETGEMILDRLAAVIAERLNSTHTQILEILTQGMDGT